MSPASLPLAKLAGMLPATQAARFEANVADAAVALAGRAVRNVSATATGGVAEMLCTLLGYLRAAGVNARRLVLTLTMLDRGLEGPQC